MRRSFRSRRGRGRSSRRRLTWSGGTFQGNQVELAVGGSFGFATADRAVFWTKYPSGAVQNFQSPEAGTDVNVIQPEEQTLVRTIVQSNVTCELQGVAQQTVSIDLVMGILAWDSNDPTHLDNNIVNGEIPHPWDPSMDWIIRIPFTFTKDNFQLNTSAMAWIESRAQRKLPRATGLLCVVGVADFIAQDPYAAEMSWGFDVRHLFKSGTYSPV